MNYLAQNCDPEIHTWPISLQSLGFPTLSFSQHIQVKFWFCFFVFFFKVHRSTWTCQKSCDIQLSYTCKYGNLEDNWLFYSRTSTIMFCTPPKSTHLESCQNELLSNSGITSVALIKRATATISHICKFFIRPSIRGPTAIVTRVHYILVQHNQQPVAFVFEQNVYAKVESKEEFLLRYLLQLSFG